MTIPKMDYPLYTINIPSIKKNVTFRPFLVKEEKLLLMAKESANISDILIAIKQIVNNCVVDSSFNISKLTVFDLEYIFLKLRALSVDNIVKVSYKDLNDGKNYDFDINLNDVKLIIPQKTDNNIKITEKSGILMKYPSASLYDDQEFLNLEKDHLFELIIRCIDKIYFEDNIIESSDCTKKELEEFIDNLSVSTFEKIQEFLLNSPKMEYVIEYTNSNNEERKIVLNSLNDFFSWR